MIGSVHAIGSWKSRDEQDNTDAIIKAVEDPTFTILGHPTGRILQARDGFPIDMIQIIEKMGEINSNREHKQTIGSTTGQPLVTTARMFSSRSLRRKEMQF